MDKQLKLKILRGSALYWLAVPFLAAWAMMYVYLVSSSQIPTLLPDYRQQLEAKEQVLRQDLIQANIRNAHSPEVAEIYRLLSLNEICLHDFTAAKEHQQLALNQSQSNFLSNEQDLTQLYLVTGNLNREMDQFELAKINYDRSLQNLKKTALSSDFGLLGLGTEAINFNNQAVLYFLLGQKTVNIQQKQKYFQSARDYFIRAKNLIPVAGSSLNKCFQQNVDENLKQCLIEIQFCQQSQ